MTFDEFQHHARKTAIYPDSAMIYYPALGLAGEAGEVANKIKKSLRDGAGYPDLDARHQIADEIADCLWYCAALASDLGLSLNGLAEANVKKLADRQRRGVLQGSGDQR